MGISSPEVTRSVERTPINERSQLNIADIVGTGSLVTLPQQSRGDTSTAKDLLPGAKINTKDGSMVFIGQPRDPSGKSGPSDDLILAADVGGASQANAAEIAGPKEQSNQKGPSSTNSPTPELPVRSKVVAP
jgi:hypothetical protein